jgi:biotin carboxyl carrier protein
MRYFVTFPGGTEVAVDITHQPTGAIAVAIDGAPVDVDTVDLASGVSSARIGGRVFDLWMEGTPPDVGVVVGGSRFFAKVESEHMRAVSAGRKDAGGGAGLVCSPMPGRVLKVLVEEGDEVAAGAPLVVVEAMKMENELHAERAGKIAKVFVAAGDTVEGGAKLVEVA